MTYSQGNLTQWNDNMTRKILATFVSIPTTDDVAGAWTRRNWLALLTLIGTSFLAGAAFGLLAALSALAPAV